MEWPVRQVFLETERLVLRQFTMADADNLVDLDADPDVMRFITGGLATSRDKIKNQLLPAFLACYRRFEGYGCWAAIEKSTGSFLGWFRFEPRDGGAPGEIALGFRLRKSAWGRGYATEGARALICKGFTELGAQRVMAQTMAISLASRRVLEKAGLNFIRIFDPPWPYLVDGRELGDAEYALSRAEWDQHNQPDINGSPAE
jgi:RimJ/RimL family protein N-acetyltransferase